MDQIVKLTAQGSISTNTDGVLALNGQDFGKTLGSILGSQYIRNAVVTIIIFDSGAEDKEEPTCPTA